jgi:hypothetical protein
MVLVMALHRSGRVAEARKTLAAATEPQDVSRKSTTRGSFKLRGERKETPDSASLTETGARKEGGKST